MKNNILVSRALRYWLRRLVFSKPKRLWFGTAIALVTALFGMALLGLSGWFISATALAGGAIALGLVVSFDVFLPGGGIRFFALGRTVSRYLERLYNHDTVLRQLALARHQLFTELTHRSIKDLRSTSNSEWLSRLTVDLDTLDSLSLRLVYPPLIAVISLLVLAGVVALFSVPLALIIVLVFLPLLLWILKILIVQTSTHAAHYANELNQARHYLIEHLMGGVELQAAQRQGAHAGPLQQYNASIELTQQRLSRLIINCQFVVTLLHGVLLVVTVFTGLTAVSEGLLSGPVAVMLVLAVYGLSEVLLSLPMQLGQWGKTNYAANRLFSMVANPQQNETDNAVSLEKNQTADIAQGAADSLSIETISLPLVKHPRVPKSWEHTLAIELDNKKMLWITGRSGSGKSTIAHSMAAVGLSYANTLYINGQPLKEAQVSMYQAEMAYLAQSNSILAATLFDNITLGLKTISEDEIWRVLGWLELTSWVDSLPQGLNTWLGDQGEALSGGQARRVCLARVLLRDVQVMILDEPFNGLDRAMSERIWRAIEPRLLERKSLILMHEKAEFCPVEAFCVDLMR